MEILNCPVCHGKAELSEYSDGFWVVGCIKKYCSSLPLTGASSRKEAIEAWNYYVKHPFCKCMSCGQIFGKVGISINTSCPKCKSFVWVLTDIKEQNEC